MKIKGNSLIINFSGYTIVNLLNSLTPIIILPILTNNISSDNIGIIDLFTTTTIFLIPIIGLCFIQSITKLYFSMEDTAKYLSVLSTSVLIIGLSTLLIGYTVLYLTPLIELSSEMRMLAMLILFYVFMTLIVEGFLLLKRNEENLRQFAGIRLMKSVLDILSTVLLLYYFDDYRVRVFGIILSTFITSLIVLYFVLKDPQIRLELDKEILRKIFIYSSPLILHTLFLNIINYSDRYFVTSYLDTYKLGQYSVIYQICMVMSLLINSFNMAWSPYFMKNMVKDEAGFMTVYNRVLWFYFIALLAFGILLFLAIPFVYEYIIGNEFEVSAYIYATLITAYIFNGLYRFKVNLLFFKERTFLIAKMSFVCASINLVMNYFLIKEFGLLGAALATLASYMAFYLLLELVLKVNQAKLFSGGSEK